MNYKSMSRRNGKVTLDAWQNSTCMHLGGKEGRLWQLPCDLLRTVAEFADDVYFSSQDLNKSERKFKQQTSAAGWVRSPLPHSCVFPAPCSTISTSERTYFPASGWESRWVTVGTAVALLLLTLPFAFQLCKRSEPSEETGLVRLLQSVVWCPEQLLFFIAVGPADGVAGD